MPFFMFIIPRIMSGLHPGSADDVNAGPVVSSGGMNATMRVIFYASMIGFSGLFFWIWHLQVRMLRLQAKHTL
jgi:heme exporter protein C